MIRNRSFLAIFYIFFIIAFTLIPFGSAVHTAMLLRGGNFLGKSAKSSLNPSDLILTHESMFESFQTIVKKVFGQEIFKETDFHQLRSYILPKIHLIKDSKLRSLIANIVINENGPANGEILKNQLIELSSNEIFGNLKSSMLRSDLHSSDSSRGMDGVNLVLTTMVITMSTFFWGYLIYHHLKVFNDPNFIQKGLCKRLLTHSSIIGLEFSIGLMISAILMNQVHNDFKSGTLICIVSSLLATFPSLYLMMNELNINRQQVSDLDRERDLEVFTVMDSTLSSLSSSSSSSSFSSRNSSRSSSPNISPSNPSFSSNTVSNSVSNQ